MVKCVIDPHEATAADDPLFIGILYRMVERILVQRGLSELYTVVINNWFDHKWLRFPYLFPVLVKKSDDGFKEFRPGKVPIPSFTAGRIIKQSYFRRDGNTNSYVKMKQEKQVLLHKERKQPSAKLSNQRQIQEISESGLFVWYSSNTVKNDRASMMVYAVKNGTVETWFAAFTKNGEWKLHSTKGIDRDAAEELLASSTV
jgi:hypothetical protein